MIEVTNVLCNLSRCDFSRMGCWSEQKVKAWILQTLCDDWSESFGENKKRPSVSAWKHYRESGVSGLCFGVFFLNDLGQILYDIRPT